MKMNQKNNSYNDKNLIIPSIDVTSKNLSLNIRSGLILNKNYLDDNYINSYSEQIKRNNKLKKSQKFEKLNPNEHLNIYSGSSNKKINGKIKRAKSVNYKDLIIKKYDNENEINNRNSYLYLEKLKKYYSTNNNNKSNLHSCSTHKKKAKIRNDFNNNIKNTNNYYTINNYYINSKLSMTIDNNKKIDSKNKKLFSKKCDEDKLKRNISHNYFNKNTDLKYNNINFNNDISNIIDTRKKFNQTYNHFYSISQNEQKSNKTINNTNSNLVIKSTINDISNKFDTSDYSTLNPYWNKRNHDNIKKIYKIKSDLFQKAQKEMKSIPKINQKSKRIANNSSKNESTSDVHYNNIYDKLFHMSYIRSLKSCTNNKKRNNKPKINEKSEKMKRTIDDLYSWNDKRKKKIKDSKIKINKKEIFNKKNINLTSEAILKERRPYYINKKVEDRLIEQGKTLEMKKEKEKQRNIKEMTKQKKFLNNNFNNLFKVKSRYMKKEENKNNDNNLNKYNISKENIFNFNYDYNINKFNKRNSLFDKSNLIKDFENNKRNNPLLLHNYMSSKIYNSKNCTKINYNMTEINSPQSHLSNRILNEEFKNNDNISDKIKNIENKSKINNIEELKLHSINNDEENIFSNFISNFSPNNNNGIYKDIKKDKNDNIFNIKDKRLEDLKKIMDFSDKLYKNQAKINS